MTARVNYFKNVEGFKEYLAGQTIYESGDPDEVMYAVKEGEVEIYFNGTLLETVGPGDVLGVKSLIDDHAHTTTAIAKTDCKIIEVDEEKFLFLVHETPMFALHIMRLLAKRTRDMMMMALK